MVFRFVVFCVSIQKWGYWFSVFSVSIHVGTSIKSHGFYWNYCHYFSISSLCFSQNNSEVHFCSFLLSIFFVCVSQLSCWFGRCLCTWNQNNQPMQDAENLSYWLSIEYLSLSHVEVGLDLSFFLSSIFWLSQTQLIVLFNCLNTSHFLEFIKAQSFLCISRVPNYLNHPYQPLFVKQLFVKSHRIWGWEEEVASTNNFYSSSSLIFQFFSCCHPYIYMKIK